MTPNRASHGPALNPDLASIPLDAALRRWSAYDGQFHLRCEYSFVVVESVRVPAILLAHDIGRAQCDGFVE